MIVPASGRWYCGSIVYTFVNLEECVLLYITTFLFEHLWGVQL